MEIDGQGRCQAPSFFSFFFFSLGLTDKMLGCVSQNLSDVEKKLIKPRISKIIQEGKQMFYHNNQDISVFYYTSTSLHTGVPLFTQFIRSDTAITIS